MKVILIKYGELTTKGDNRKYFINVLYNILKYPLFSTTNPPNSLPMVNIAKNSDKYIPAFCSFIL